MARRRKADEAGLMDGSTPRKTRRGDPSKQTPPRNPNTPSARKSILRDTPTKANGALDTDPTPKSLKRVLFSTPARAEHEAGALDDETPVDVRNDRSALRKSRRVLQRLHLSDDRSEDGDAEQDEAVAEQILREQDGAEDNDDGHDDDGDDDDDDDDDDDLGQEGGKDEDELTHEPSSGVDTPSKSGRPRGRPKGRRRERTPSPPPDLPAHELYFFQNRPGGNRTSSNTLPQHLLLNHEDYFAQIDAYEDPHQADIAGLKRLHKRAFDQWMFELQEGFNLCLYGYGSKRNLAMDFAEHLHKHSETTPSIVVVNGYAAGLTIRDALVTLAKVLVPTAAKLPAQPGALLELVVQALDDPSTTRTITMIIHSIDHLNLRKIATQAILARLASHAKISLLATADTPNFALMWDVALRGQFRFLFHDATTFEAFRVEMDAVEEVNALLGRSNRRLGGKDGAVYVLNSLPENARSLFRILVSEQLAMAGGTPQHLHREDPAEASDIDPQDLIGVEDEMDAAAQQDTPSRRDRGRSEKKPIPPRRGSAQGAAPDGVEYRSLYQKAVTEFVCTSELNFRTLLKEFHDHQLIETRKDATGTERLAVPFRREELETLLEDGV